MKGWSWVSDYADAMVWMNLSQRDHDIALHLQKTFIPLPVETICFHSQQAVEKALKAVLAYYCIFSLKAAISDASFGHQ